MSCNGSNFYLSKVDANDACGVGNWTRQVGGRHDGEYCCLPRKGSFFANADQAEQVCGANNYMIEDGRYRCSSTTTALQSGCFVDRENAALMCGSDYTLREGKWCCGEKKSSTCFAEERNASLMCGDKNWEARNGQFCCKAGLVDSGVIHHKDASSLQDCRRLAASKGYYFRQETDSGGRCEEAQNCPPGGIQCKTISWTALNSKWRR